MEIISKFDNNFKSKSAKKPVGEGKFKGFKAKNIKHFNGILKVLTGVLIIVNILSYGITKALLEDQNKYLNYVGVNENTGQRLDRTTTKNQSLQQKVGNLGERIYTIGQRIEQEDFYVNADLIESVQSGQQLWLTDFSGGTKQLGLIDAISKLEQYFNDGHLEHNILFKSGNELQIKSMSFDEEQATFTINCSNFFGNIFLLSSEVVNIINGLPHFQNGKILTYQRQKKRDGNDGMSFSLTVQMQGAESVDPDDGNASSTGFLNWAYNQL